MYMHAKSKSILIQLDAWESGVQWIARLLLIYIYPTSTGAGYKPISPAPEPIRLNLVASVCKFQQRLCPIRRHLRPTRDLSCFS